MWKSEQKIKPNKPIWCHHTKLNTLQHLVHTYIPHIRMSMAVYAANISNYRLKTYIGTVVHCSSIFHSSLLPWQNPCCASFQNILRYLSNWYYRYHPSHIFTQFLTYSARESYWQHKVCVVCLGPVLFYLLSETCIQFFSTSRKFLCNFLWSLYIFADTIYARVCKKHREFEYVHKYNANSCDYDNSTSIIMIFICFSHINGRTLRSTASRQSALTTAISIIITTTTTTTITTNFIAKIVYIRVDTMRKG